MRVNRKLIPLKAHYFCFLGCLSPVLPFLIVVGLHLGISVSVMGSLSAVSLLLVVVAKPLISLLADAVPSLRRAVFLSTLVAMVGAFGSVGFLPPARRPFGVSRGRLLAAPGDAAHLRGAGGGGEAPRLVAFPDEGGGCRVAAAWDCVLAGCDPEGRRRPPCDASFGIEALEEGGASRGRRLFRLKGGAPGNASWGPFAGDLSLECRGGEWKGDECAKAWEYWSFWVFAVLLLVGNVALGTANSVTDAIIVDVIGDHGDYGLQRAWGTVGWGLMGPISGLLIDWWSGTSVTKNYWPAFLLCFVLGTADIVISAIYIKVPEMKRDPDILTKIGPILRQPKFFTFCCFIVLSGAFDGVVANFIFIMQEDMARGTSVMNYMKFLQGLTIFVQCGFEAPFMFINSWVMRKLGGHYVISLVLFLFVFRLVGLAAVGMYGPVWATLLVEFLNGPCYGLGYTAIVIHSARVSPPGTSNTVQSVTNICYESLGYGLSLFAGGLLYSAVGGPAMYFLAGLTAALTFLLHLIFLRLLPPDEDSRDAIKETSAKEICNEEKSVLNCGNTVHNDDEGREKEENSSEMTIQPKGETESSCQMDQFAQWL